MLIGYLDKINNFIKRCQVLQEIYLQHIFKTYKSL